MFAISTLQVVSELRVIHENEKEDQFGIGPAKIYFTLNLRIKTSSFSTVSDRHISMWENSRLEASL